MAPKKKTQAELLLLLSPAPFDQRNTSYLTDATISRSQPDTWWRTESPRDKDEQQDILQWTHEYNTKPKTPEPETIRDCPTTGVFSWRKRPEHLSQYQVGLGPVGPYKAEDTDARAGTISGYSGFIPGKYAGNTVGGTFNQSNYDAEQHLMRTAQAIQYGVAASNDQPAS